MKRLIDRVRAWGMTSKLHIARDAARRLEDVPVFVADDVWTAIDEGEQDVWTPDDFTNLAPVYPTFWIEAQSLHGRGLMGGLLFEDATEDDAFIQSGPHGAGLRELHPEVRWVYRVFGYASVGGGRHISVFPGYAYIHVGENGEWLDDPLNVNFAVMGGDAMQAAVQDVRLAYAVNALTVHDFTVMIPMAFMTLSLLHSRQIETVENAPGGAEARKWRKRTGQAMVTFKTLRVKPTRRDQGEGAGQIGIRDYMRSHAVRGQWRTYTDAAPLFGKITGRIFVPAHRRGKRASGEVNKRYEVLP